MNEERELEEHNDEEGFNFLEALHVLVKRKMTIVKLCALGSILAAAYSYTLPDLYSATAKVLPPQKEGGPSLSSMVGQLGGLAGAAAGKGENELYLAILKSRSVGDAVIQQLDLGKVYATKSLNQTRQRLDEAVKVAVGKEGIISITATDQSPKMSALLANTMADQLGRTMVRLNLSKAGTERIFLEKRLEVVRKDLRAAENDLKAFAQRNKIAHVESQATASVSGVARLKADLAGKEVRLAALRASQTEESFEVQETEAVIARLKGELARAGSAGDADGVPGIGMVPSVGLEYTRKLRELKTQEAIFEQLSKQHEMVKLTEAKDTSSLQILDEALPPESKSQPVRSKIVFKGTLAGFLLSLLLIVVGEYLEKMPEEDRRVVENIRRRALSLKEC